MDPSPPTWLQRFLRTIPPMSDGAYLILFILMLLMLGIFLGHTLCEWQHRETVQRLSFQQQIDAINARLKALESR